MSKLEEPYDGMFIKKKTDSIAIQAIVDPLLLIVLSHFDVEMLRKDFFDISGNSSRRTNGTDRKGHHGSDCK